MSKHSQAFTLIEFLLGISIFSIMALTLYGSFFSAMKINRVSKTVNSLFREASWTLDNLSRDLENMIFYDFDPAYSAQRCFLGQKTSVQFILAKNDGLKVVKYLSKSIAPGSIFQVIVNKPSSRIQAMTHKYEKGVKREVFVREEVPWSDFFQRDRKGDSSREEETDILSTHLQEGSLRFSYAYLKGNKDHPQIEWSDHWDHDTLPFWIKINAVFLPSERGQESWHLTRDVFIPVSSWGKEKSS